MEITATGGQKLMFSPIWCIIAFEWTHIFWRVLVMLAAPPPSARLISDLRGLR